MVTNSPNTAIQTAGLEKLPKPTNDESELTINLPFCRPIKAIKIPIPALIAYFKSWGMALITISLKRNRY